DGLPGTFKQQPHILPAWARYSLGVIAELTRAGAVLRGFDAVVHGDVPVGGGMSSSAAIEVATAQACMLFSNGRFTIGTEGTTLTPLEEAGLCQHTEHITSGVRSGILDQAAFSLGRPHHALLPDSSSL